jgi:hypothetical protein
LPTMSTGGHALDLAEAVLGPIVEVDATTEILWPTVKLIENGEERLRETADHADVLGKTHSGAVFTVDVNASVALAPPRFGLNIRRPARDPGAVLQPIHCPEALSAVREATTLRNALKQAAVAILKHQSPLLHAEYVTAAEQDRCLDVKATWDFHAATNRSVAPACLATAHSQLMRIGCCTSIRAGAKPSPSRKGKEP